MILCWYGAIRAGLEAANLPSVTSLRYHTPELTAVELKHIRQSQKLQAGDRTAFSAFTQLEGQTVRTIEYEKSTTGNVLLFYGDLRLVVNPSGMRGSFTSSADINGCALDVDTAYKLWGSDNVLGQKLEYEEREYIVRAVFESPAGVIVIPLPDSTDQKFSALSLDTRDSKNPRSAADEFRSRYGIPEADAVTTGDWIAGTARLLMILPALILGLILLLQILRELWAVRNMPVLFTLWLLAVAAVLILMTWASGIRLSIPQSLIPTRWSDFEFWKRTFVDWWDQFRRSFAAPRLVPDLMMSGIFARMGIYSVMSTGLMILAFRKPRKAQEDAANSDQGQLTVL